LSAPSETNQTGKQQRNDMELINEQLAATIYK
jgi:hypothetical protein